MRPLGPPFLAIPNFLDPRLPPPLRRRRPSARLGVLGLVLLVGLSVADTAGAADPITETDKTIETLRQQAERAADAYFDTLSKAQTLETQIAAIEDRLPRLAGRRR